MIMQQSIFERSNLIFIQIFLVHVVEAELLWKQINKETIVYKNDCITLDDGGCYNNQTTG